MAEIKNKLNIAMVCDPIGSNKSGVVVSTIRFSKLLKERGHNVIFIGARSAEHKDDSNHDGIKAYRFRSLLVPKSGGWNLAFPTVGELKEIFQKEKIDIVHLILPMSGAVMAVRAARALGIKIVAHSHSQPENLFMEMPKIIQPLLGSLWNKYLAWMYGKAELIIYPSEMARNILHKLCKKEQSSVVISNGINLKHFQPTEIGDFFERFHIPADKIKLLFVGRLFPEKSVDTLIRAIPHIIKEYPNIHVMIVGAGHLRKNLENLAHRLSVEKYVTFLGLISEEDKVLAFNACNVFVLPSLAELEGMVVLEAMACGKPIVVSDAKMSASRYFVTDNGFLFRTKDHEHLARQILKLAADPKLRKKMGEISFEKSKQYDIHKSADALEAAYYSVLKNNSENKISSLQDRQTMKEHLFEERIFYKKNEFKPDRPTLIFMHGVSGSSSAWLPYEKIFENKYNILTFDIRGHGKSKKYPDYSDYEVKHFANDLHDLVSFLNIQKFILISNSFAGLVHLKYLKLYGENVLANIFTSPEIFLNKTFAMRIMYFVLKIFTAIISLLPFDPKPRGHVDYAKHIGSTDWNIKRNVADIKNTGLHAHFYTLRQSFSPSLEYPLKKITAPTLIVHGEKDSMVPIKNAIDISKKIKNSEFVSIKNVDHNTVHNGVKELSNAIEAFIEKNKNMLQ